MSDARTSASTHVLDAALGRPAAGLRVVLTRPAADVTSDVTADVIADVVTDDDGRVRFDVGLAAGVHTLTFATGAWFAAAGRATFFPEVTVVFEVDPAQGHHHVALLLSPFSYTTYRGS